MSITFKKRGLMVTFELAQGAFNSGAGSKDDAVDIENLAIRASIDCFGMGSSQAQISITGLSIDLINRLTVMKANPKGNAYQLNTVTLTAKDGDEDEAVIFSGAIYLAVADFNVAPNVPMMIHATSLYSAIMTVPEAKNIPSGANAADVMKMLATEGNLGFVNHGVDVPIKDVSLNGNLGDMLRQVAHMANIEMYIEPGGVVNIAMKGQPRQDVPRVPITKYDGMVGYPRPLDFGCLVSCLYSPKYRILGKVTVDVPGIPAVNGDMIISSLTHRVDSETPGGQWFSDMKLLRFSSAPATTPTTGGA